MVLNERLASFQEDSTMHVMNCVSLANEKENGDLSVTAGLMLGPTAPPPPPPPPPCPFPASGFPPPPPPGAPPPPPFLTSGLNGHSKKKRMRSFFWKTIPEEQVRGKANLWTMAARKHQYQIDTKTIEELFGQQEEAKNAIVTKTRSPRSSFREAKDEISLLDAKRSMNIGIFLKQFKKSAEDIVEDIRMGRCDLYESDSLQEFLKLLPDTEEVKKLKAFVGDVLKLSQADSFMCLLIQVPNYSLRIEAMVLKKEFLPSLSSLNKQVSVIRVAMKELMTCEQLHSILYLVLQAGNIMNAGGYAGNAVGFKLSSLLKLADTKANKPGMNLLHFVALEAQKKDAALLSFSEKLQHVHDAARLSIDNFELEFSTLSTKTTSLRDSVRKDPELLQQMEEFLQLALKEVNELERLQVELKKESHALIDFFCEDKGTMKLDECFQIFRDFCDKFNKAVKENREREIKDLRQKQRLKELEEKRHSWTAGEHGFGRSSSENDVVLLATNGIEDFLPFLQQRPQSPSCRAPSSRRSRHSLGVATDRELRTFLDTPNVEESNKFNSLPRVNTRQPRPSVAWMEAKDGRETSFNNLHLNLSTDVKPSSQTSYLQNEEATRTIPAVLSASNQEIPDKNNNKVEHRHRKPSGLSPLAVDIEAHELIMGLHQFDSQGANTQEVPLINVEDIILMDVEMSDDLSLQSLSITDDNTIPFGKSPTAVRLATDCPPNKTGPCISDPVAATDSYISDIKEHDPLFYITDATDCSLTLDCSDSNDLKMVMDENKSGSSAVDSSLRDQSSTSSSRLNSGSPTRSIPSASGAKSVDASKKANLQRDKPAKSKAQPNTNRNDSMKDKAVSSYRYASTRNSSTLASKPVRMLNDSEHENMRKVVPISKFNRTASSLKRTNVKETSSPERRPVHRNSVGNKTDTLPRSPYKRSLPAEELPAQRRGSQASSSSHFTRDQVQRKSSAKKPSAKPVRNIPRQKPEETKICRTSMKALAYSDVNKIPAAASPKTPAHTPSFARNTVASSSRHTKVEPSTPTKATALTRLPAHPQPKGKPDPLIRSPTTKDNGSMTPLRRASSLRVSGKKIEPSPNPRVKTLTAPKEKGIMEKSSIKLKDTSKATLGKILKPLLK
ncbi:FH2 domain-containing protein 1 [Ambystoma mexicanum]|uniref:FH2 domain-containing protein 1 n=1 Tax=Ambystoma mexicanum TaxID=8296 RepID=UPI0037E8B5FF